MHSWIFRELEINYMQWVPPAGIGYVPRQKFLKAVEFEDMHGLVLCVVSGIPWILTWGIKICSTFHTQNVFLWHFSVASIETGGSQTKPRRRLSMLDKRPWAIPTVEFIYPNGKLFQILEGILWGHLSQMWNGPFCEIIIFFIPPPICTEYLT